jgi:hypothetical protein
MEACLFDCRYLAVHTSALKVSLIPYEINRALRHGQAIEL